MTISTEGRLLDRILLGFLSVTVVIGKSYEATLQAMDSSTYARLALDATRGALRLPIGDARIGEGFWPTGFNDHPFTLIWLSGKVMRWLGPSGYSARLLPSFFAVVAVLAVYQYGVRVAKSRAGGLVGGFLLLMTPLFVSYSARFQLDPAMLAGIAISFVGYFSGNLLVTVVGVVLAVWVKGPLGFLVFPSALMAILLVRRRDLAEWRKLVVYSACGIFAGSMIWALIAVYGSKDLVADYWGRWIFGQIAKNGNSSNWGTFAFILKRNFLWIPAIIVMLTVAIRKGIYRDFALVGAFSGTLIVFLLVLSMEAKFEHYYLPCFLTLTLAGTVIFREWGEKYLDRIRKGGLALAIALPSVLVASPISLGPERFPQLKRWIPFIQRHGSCRDRILLVHDGVPYGSIRDYAAVLQFYVNRPTSGVSGCDELKRETAGANPPAWIIVGDATLKCWGGGLPAGYFAEFRYGTQVLIGRVDLSKEAVDLTFLEGEMKAIADCEVPQTKPSNYLRER